MIKQTKKILPTWSGTNTFPFLIFLELKKVEIELLIFGRDMCTFAYITLYIYVSMEI